METPPKATTLRTLMSYVMPLPCRTVERRLHASPDKRIPSSRQELARSQTFQAVVCNAKAETVSFLAGLGFDSSKDLIILDPVEELCFTWDVAKDVDSRNDIRIFTDLLIPKRAEWNRKDSDAAFFEGSARLLIADLIVAFRNAALAQGLQPAWTLRDILNAIARPDCLRYLLQWHDAPAEATAPIDLPAVFDGILATAQSFLAPFCQAADRWDEAADLGRTISLKDWIGRGRNTVLVLPNTESNVLVNGPLNRLMLGALTKLLLTHEHSFVCDQSGHSHIRRRYFFFDEISDAGKLPSFMRLLTWGRYFGVNIVLGLNVISELEATYGREHANTLLTLCPLKGHSLAEDPGTTRWMAEFVGDRLGPCSLLKE